MSRAEASGRFDKVLKQAQVLSWRLEKASSEALRVWDLSNAALKSRGGGNMKEVTMVRREVDAALNAAREATGFLYDVLDRLDKVRRRR